MSCWTQAPSIWRAGRRRSPKSATMRRRAAFSLLTRGRWPIFSELRRRRSRRTRGNGCSLHGAPQRRAGAERFHHVDRDALAHLGARGEQSRARDLRLWRRARRRDRSLGRSRGTRGAGRRVGSGTSCHGRRPTCPATWSARLTRPRDRARNSGRDECPGKTLDIAKARTSRRGSKIAPAYNSGDSGVRRPVSVDTCRRCPTVRNADRNYIPRFAEREWPSAAFAAHR